MKTFYYEENDCTRDFRSQISLKLDANMVAHLQGAVTDAQTVRDRWYSSFEINTYLDKSLARGLRLTWLERHVDDEEC